MRYHTEPYFRDLEYNVVENPKSFTPSFISQVSHELKTPIVGIVGMTDILSKSDLTEKQWLYVKSILDCANSLKKVQNHIHVLLKQTSREALYEPC